MISTRRNILSGEIDFRMKKYVFFFLLKENIG
jgi:hypothetical protein